MILCSHTIRYPFLLSNHWQSFPNPPFKHAFNIRNIFSSSRFWAFTCPLVVDFQLASSLACAIDHATGPLCIFMFIVFHLLNTRNYLSHREDAPIWISIYKESFSDQCGTSQFIEHTVLQSGCYYKSWCWKRKTKSEDTVTSIIWSVTDNCRVKYVTIVVEQHVVIVMNASLRP